MWCILCDNLSAIDILDMCENPNDKEFKQNYYVQRYLYALVLWEAIYRVRRGGTSERVYDQRCEERSANRLVRRVKSTIFDIPFEYDFVHMDMVMEELYDEKYNIDGYEEHIKKDAVYYLTLGQAVNMNTMLSEKRAMFVEDAGIARKIWSRESILDYIDKEVFEIYKEVCAVMDKEVIRVQTPLVVDYICKSATCLRDAIDIAFQLKEQKDIILFRQTMNSLDEAINLGNILQVKEYQKALSEIIEQFIKKELPTQKIDVELAITPSITNPSFSATFGIPINYNSKRKINMNFLVDLVKYGLTERGRYLW